MKVFEWDDLRVFLAIYRGRSVRAASKLMGVSHSTISRRLQAMESQLDLKLFVRHNEGFILTEMGEAMVERAERVESEILSMEREVFGRDALLSGPIRITMLPHIAQHLIIPHIVKFTALYPDIHIEIDANNNIVDLDRRNADIAIRFQAEPEDHLIGRKLPDFGLAVYASLDYEAEHSFTGKKPSARWLSWEKANQNGLLSRWIKATPYAYCQVQHSIADPLALQQAVIAGLGFAYLFSFTADQASQLKRLPNIDMQFIPAWILTHPDSIATERVKVFARFLWDALNEDKDLIQGTIN
ncbi:LysR family transcriptional regulator [Marinomonas sp. PE14-40]|uniref:LysR family transcriptional regulator n=1 Tax=Marinomonas sp. PE14-40 TaxID=3060621 RepID=UPI003F67EE0E